MIDVFGYIGLSCILLAYILASVDYIDHHSYLYYIINLIGSASLTWYAYELNSIPFIILNVVWVVFTIMEIIKLARKK